ncbi:transcription factor bHLH118-like [Durio zibethinus]|uniref:Transcription factor bHLH118-like n=1 Tax=Durio zibethinus TaxID=66656 RepID=A0A6P5YDS1_DURZI|nr:transcription factor bHLH118-like [Durio zibethinus]
MFPSHQSDDFLYEIYGIPHHGDFVQQNLTSGEASVEGSNRIGKGKRPKNLAAAANNNDGNYATANDAKKILRKEIERQRRQKMAKLYGKLRSLLPVESIKGKRAVSDHMNEAVNYIKYLKKMIQELSVKRDKLKKLSNLSALDQGSSASSSENCSPINSCVAVHPYQGGVEIVINSGFGDESWHLSIMMLVILEEGLDVVRYVSSQTNEGFLHTIHSEVSDPTQLDLPRLQTKLNDMISYRDTLMSYD